MRRNLATVLAIMLAFASASVLALGLGEIRLNSYLNQRLDAEIELVSATAEELETLEIGLADRKIFEQQGIPRLPELSSLKFRVVRRPNGTAYIKVTSTEPMKEPFLTFLVEIEWSRGRLLREYTLLLDPPTFKEDRAAIQEEQASAPAVPAVQPEPDTGPETGPAATEPTPADILRGDVAEEPATDTAGTEEVEEPVQVAEESGDVVSVPALEDDAEQPAPRETQRATTRTSGAVGGEYGPIQRSETLWGIAQRLRPDSSITMNQMMLAIYRANPEAFMGNINRLKAGYILRIPEYDEITSLTANEAFREAKRQNEEWRGGDSGSAMYATESDEASAEEAEPSLSLVAPEESEEPDFGMAEDEVGAGDETGMADADTAAVVDSEDDIDEGAVDLGVEETGEERLGDVESETLQAMQDSETPLPDTEAETAAADEEGVQEPGMESGQESDQESAEPLDLPPLPEDGTATEGTEDALADESAADATATEGEAASPAEQAEMAGQVDAGQEEAAAAQQDSRTAAPVRPAREPSLMEKVMAFVLAPLGMAVIGAILLLLVLVALLMRKRRSDAAKQAAAEMSSWDESDLGGDDDATVVAADDDQTESDDDDATVFAADESSSEEDDFQGMFGGDEDREEETGTQRIEEDTEATQMLSESDRAEAGAADEDFTDTMVGGETQMLDENDPLSEADFHMAYGLYDQAAEVVEKAIANNPGSKELKVKLAEIHFAADNKDGFVEAAKNLHDQVGSGDADWNNIVIMGKQIAGDNPLFAEGGSSSGSVDLDFAAAGEDEGTQESGESVDFDIPAEPSEPAPEATSQETAGDDEIDFDMDFGLGDEGESGSAVESAPESTEEPASSESGSGEDIDFDLDLGESETSDDVGEAPDETSGGSDDDTQTEFDKALQELSAYVDTNAPDKGGKAAEESSDDLNLDEFNFDSESGSASDSSGEGLGDDELGDDEQDELGEIGTKLDLARAYIDMGDPDGARSILEEVVAEGDDEQKKEAQELIDQLG